MSKPPLTAPFPYFGGKRAAAPMIWRAFGSPGVYVEPFCGSCAVLLARPNPAPGKREIVNDANGMLANVWRALKYAPEEVAALCDLPKIETEYHARDVYLYKNKAELVSRLEGDINYYDATMAAAWLYTDCISIRINVNAPGPWVLEGNRFVRKGAGAGLSRGLIDISTTTGIFGRLPPGETRGQYLRRWFEALSARLESVYICNGDWTRVVKDSAFSPGQPPIAVFLDPPYAGKGSDVYQSEGHATVAQDVEKWCATAPAEYRIALAGYGDEHDALLALGWRKRKSLAARSGFGNVPTASREKLWFSPACIYDAPRQGDLFEDLI